MRHLRGRNDQAGDESEIDLTPMLDVVFIMLIFFIVTASFLKEAGIEINRPEDSQSNPSESENILIQITANDEIWLNQRRIDLRALRSHIERLHAENPKAAVAISAHKEATAKVYTQVADSAREAGVYEVSMVVKDK
jgi:biopolymer transport protein ExbD